MDQITVSICVDFFSVVVYGGVGEMEEVAAVWPHPIFNCAYEKFSILSPAERGVLNSANSIIFKGVRPTSEV